MKMVSYNVFDPKYSVFFLQMLQKNRFDGYLFQVVFLDFQYNFEVGYLFQKEIEDQKQQNPGISNAK